MSWSLIYNEYTGNLCLDIHICIANLNYENDFKKPWEIKYEEDSFCGDHNFGTALRAKNPECR